jgi:hypothetical protein
MSASGTVPSAADTKKPEDEGNFFEKLVKRFYNYILIPTDQTIFQILPELGHLSPVIMIMGTAFFALVTMNYPLSIFSASSVEAFWILSWFQSLTHATASPTAFVRMEEKTKGQILSCKSRFQITTPSRFSAFMSQGLVEEYPNSALYMISYATAYLLQSLTFFQKEMENLGPSYSNRPYLAMIAGGLFLSLYSAYLLMYGCDSLTSMFAAILLGLFVGYLIANQNALLLGKSSVNVLFTPELAIRKGMDYLCVTTKV